MSKKHKIHGFNASYPNYHPHKFKFQESSGSQFSSKACITNLQLLAPNSKLATHETSKLDNKISIALKTLAYFL